MARRSKRLSLPVWDPLKTGYAELSNPEWEFLLQLPSGFWSDSRNHKRYLTWLAKKLGIKKLDDWYQVRNKDFVQNHGSSLLDHFEHSHVKLLQKIFPRKEWLPWKFAIPPLGFWQDIENCRKYARWFEKQVGITNIKQWYDVTKADLAKHDGAGLIDRFQCSMIKLLRALFPDYDWQPFLLKHAPYRYWRNKQNRIRYLKWLEWELGYKNAEDWYQITKRDFTENRGGSLMMLRKIKVIDLVRELYPDFDWQPWNFKQVHQHCWDEKKYRLQFLKYLGEQLGYAKQNDWYQVKLQDFVDHGGGSLIYNHYRSDWIRALKELFPGSKWLEWKFYQVPVGFWDKTENVRAYLRWLANELGVRSKTDWYEVTREQIRSHHGSGLLRRFKTLYKALRFAYPKWSWHPWLFENSPVGFWQEKENRKTYYRWLAKQLGYSRPEDWSSLSAATLRQYRGHTLVSEFKVNNVVREAMELAVN